MVYNWNKPGLFSVSAQDAGEELERIYQERGKIEAKDVVDESRPADAVLHPCFEWRDDIAAEKYREEQARGLCRCLITVSEQEGNEPVSLRAVFHVQGAYHPTQVIIREEDKYDELLQSCLKELISVKKKFSILSNKEEIQKIFSAIDDAAEADNEHQD